MRYAETMRRVSWPLAVVLTSGLVLGARPVAAEDALKIPVSVMVVGSGSIRLRVAEGASRPCESSENHMLFDGRAKAGDEIRVTSSAAVGSVCVDHTYGAFRETQWSGPVIYSAGDFGPQPSSAVLSVRISTESP
jgi:hypothetical protein